MRWPFQDWLRRQFLAGLVIWYCAVATTPKLRQILRPITLALRSELKDPGCT
jgi:hypothetical protein